MKREEGMINFTVGPVKSSSEVLEIGAEQTPYFRTSEFSEVMLENERLMKKFTHAGEETKVIFLTGSGTAAMEAAVINTLDSQDKALVVNGGSFGARFVELLRIHQIPYDEIKLEVGQPLTAEVLAQYDPKNYTAFLVNLHETSTGVLYDLELIHDFCAKNNLFLIVDAISAFLADEINFDKAGIDVMLTGSQKALACPPGVSILVLSERALERIKRIDSGCLYLDLDIALDNAKRGQTPFTPAVGILRQINKRLRCIDDEGGDEAEIKKVADLAQYFRNKLKEENLPFELVTDQPSNAVTSLHPTTTSANEIFLKLKDEYRIWICPNGGDLKDKIFRVGHIGALTYDDYDALIAAFKDLQVRGVI